MHHERNHNTDWLVAGTTMLENTNEYELSYTVRPIYNNVGLHSLDIVISSTYIGTRVCTTV